MNRAYKSFYSFNKCLLDTYNVPGLVLDPGGTYGRVLALTELKCFVENKVSEQPKEYPGISERGQCHEEGRTG